MGFWETRFSWRRRVLGVTFFAFSFGGFLYVRHSAEIPYAIVLLKEARQEQLLWEGSLLQCGQQEDAFVSCAGFL